MTITGWRPLAHHHRGTTTKGGVGGAHQGGQKGECCQVRLVWWGKGGCKHIGVDEAFGLKRKKGGIGKRRDLNLGRGGG